jgi:hypothetical protein
LQVGLIRHALPVAHGHDAEGAALAAPRQAGRRVAALEQHTQVPGGKAVAGPDGVDRVHRNSRSLEHRTVGDHEGPLGAAGDDDLRRAELAERPRCLDRVDVAARHDRELILVEEDDVDVTKQRKRGVPGGVRCAERSAVVHVEGHGHAMSARMLHRQVDRVAGALAERHRDAGDVQDVGGGDLGEVEVFG